jgi:Fic family protein
MQSSKFAKSTSGKIVTVEEGCFAFVPNPLPPVIEPNWELVSLISEADRALAELAGAARTLPNPHLLIRSFIGREAVLSSRIEGTQASLSDIFLFQGLEEKAPEEKCYAQLKTA